MDLKKIVVIGPESTGKSTLCEQLALHYGSRWCPEYAREYLVQNGRNYGFNDLLTIAQGQLAQEDAITNKVIAAGGTGTVPLFIDTDMYVMKVWCEFVFNQCHRFILDQIVERKYDLYLLCNTDLPWVKDELREYPDPETRQRLFSIYKDILVNQSVPWVEVSGVDPDRFHIAKSAVDQLLKP